jgi:hypothetical protein
MALTGKTIGQLELLQFPTNETLLPVEYLGDTYHIAFSSITYNEGSYSQFVVEANNGLLTPGRWYLMTDFQSCYDQPNYDNFKNPIFTGNYMTGNTEPILLLAISTTGFSPTVYSTLYPQDKITYDITWNTTEITAGPAKGRITERIDNFNNRTDYDHRNILFKRYIGYSYDENASLSGLVGISGLTGTTGVLYGNTGTTFNSNFGSGSIVSIRNLNPSFFEILSVESDSLAIISGVTISETTDSPYYYGNDDGIMSYYQPNVRQDEVFEYTTFGDVIDNSDALNNYVGNQANLFIKQGTGDFLLANNVFLDGPIVNNTIGNGSYNNTFNDDCDNNQIGDRFYNNSTNDDFDGNIIGENFNNNYITSNFNNNRIGSDFDFNILLGGSFYRNNIGNDFNNNVWTNSDFQNNEIGNQFNNNKIYNDFYNNDIGNGYNNNESYSSFYRNLIGNGYNGNTVYSQFYENNIEQIFQNNTIGSNLTIGVYNFSGNKIGSDFGGNQIRYYFQNNNILNDFYNNTFSGDCYSNTIKNYFQNNTLLGVIGYNQIGDNFQNNIIGDGFGVGLGGLRGNIIGNLFANNIIGEYFYDNTFGDECTNNNIADYFINNKVSHGFNGVTTNDLDSSGYCQNNNFTFGLFSGDLTFSSGVGGNPILYTEYTVNVMKDSQVGVGTTYVTFLSGGTIVAETITI